MTFDPSTCCTAPSDMLAWFDVTQSANVTSVAGVVTAWSNYAGSGTVAFTNLGSPTAFNVVYTAAVQNGLAMMVFDGSGGLSQVSGGLYAGNAPRTMARVFTITDYAADAEDCLDSQWPQTANAHGSAIQNSSGISWDADGPSIYPQTNVGNDGACHLVVLIYDGATATLRIDGVTVGTVVGPLDTTQAMQWDIGFDGSTPPSFSGLIGNLGDGIYYDEALSGDNLAYLESGLMEKFGIVARPPPPAPSGVKIAGTVNSYFAFAAFPGGGEGEGGASFGLSADGVTWAPISEGVFDPDGGARDPYLWRYRNLFYVVHYPTDKGDTCSIVSTPDFQTFTPIVSVQQCPTGWDGNVPSVCVTADGVVHLFVVAQGDGHSNICEIHPNSPDPATWTDAGNWSSVATLTDHASAVLEIGGNTWIQQGMDGQLWMFGDDGPGAWFLRSNAGSDPTTGWSDATAVTLAGSSGGDTENLVLIPDANATYGYRFRVFNSNGDASMACWESSDGGVTWSAKTNLAYSGFTDTYNWVTPVLIQIDLTNLTAGNVKNTVNIAGVPGTYDPITGNYTDPGIAHVQSGTEYTFAGDPLTGTLADSGTPPVQSQVLAPILLIYPNTADPAPPVQGWYIKTISGGQPQFASGGASLMFNSGSNFWSLFLGGASFYGGATLDGTYTYAGGTPGSGSFNIALADAGGQGYGDPSVPTYGTLVVVSPANPYLLIP